MLSLTKEALLLGHGAVPVALHNHVANNYGLCWSVAPATLAANRPPCACCVAMQCTFDSTDRTNWTRGGVATQDEMCFHWIFYYPADEDMNMCFTFGTTPAAVCGATYPPQLQAINETNAGTMVPQLIQQGSLLFAPDPANSSTHYREVCNPSPVV